MNFRRNNAFSLIELLITIAVIAVLAAIALPFAKSTIERARSTTCLNYLRQLATATMAYGADHRSEVVPVDRKNPNTGTSWYVPLGEYLVHAGYGKRSGPYFCPANPTKVVASGNAGWTNYAVNGNLYVVNTSEQANGADNPNHMLTRRGARPSELSSPKALYIDALEGTPQAPRTWYIMTGARYSNPWGSTLPVHGERVNVVFTDGHAESSRIAPRPSPLRQGGDLLELKASSFWPL